MTPRKIHRNGFDYWMVDLRTIGKGRVFATTEADVIKKVQAVLYGTTEIEITVQDKLAKKELLDAAPNASLLDAVRYYIAREPAARIQKGLKAAIEECVSLKTQKKRREAYTSHLKQILGQFLVYAGDVPCSEIATKHINGFLESKPWEASTRLGMRNRLSAFFTYCIKKGYVIKNPVDGVEMETVERKRPEIFTVEDTHRLLDTALYLDPAMVPYYVLGIFCGIRPEELQFLDPKSVHIDAKHVEVPEHVSKTRDCRIVDLSENAIAWLRAANRSLMWSRTRHREILALSRIKWSSDIMRHTFATYHVAFHESADKTALQMGHQGSTRMLFKHYRRGGITKAIAQEFWNIEPAPFIRVLAKAVNE